jgi:hypothetical protein
MSYIQTVGSANTINFSYPSPLETVLGFPESLPTSEPENPQFSYTLSSSQFATITGSYYSVKHTAFMHFGGKNNGSAAYLSYKILKNGAAVQTGGYQSDTNYYCNSNYNLFDVQAGDVIAVKAWAGSSNFDLRWYGIMLIPTSLVISQNPIIIKNISIANSNLLYANNTLRGADSLRATYIGVNFVDHESSLHVGYSNSSTPVYSVNKGDIDRNNLTDQGQDSIRYHSTKVPTSITYTPIYTSPTQS